MQQQLTQPLAQLLEASWRSHTLDCMLLRAAGLAAEQAASLREQEASLAVEAGWLDRQAPLHSAQHAADLKAAAELAAAHARALQAALQAALRAYYEPESGAAAGSSAGGGSGRGQASQAAWAAHVSAAVQRSLLKHPPPASGAALESLAPALPLHRRFVPLSSARVERLGLQRSSGLSASTCSQLCQVPAGPALPEVSSCRNAAS